MGGHSLRARAGARQIIRRLTAAAEFFAFAIGSRTVSGPVVKFPVVFIFRTAFLFLLFIYFFFSLPPFRCII